LGQDGGVGETVVVGEQEDGREELGGAWMFAFVGKEDACEVGRLERELQRRVVGGGVGRSGGEVDQICGACPGDADDVAVEFPLAL